MDRKEIEHTMKEIENGAHPDWRTKVWITSAILKGFDQHLAEQHGPSKPPVIHEDSLATEPCTCPTCYSEAPEPPQDEIRVGDLVECIENADVQEHLTKGNIYTVQQVHDFELTINGRKFAKSRFRELQSEKREHLRGQSLSSSAKPDDPYRPEKVIPTVKEWDCWNPSYPVGATVMHFGVLHKVIDAGKKQGIRLAAIKPRKIQPEPERKSGHTHLVYDKETHTIVPVSTLQPEPKKCECVKKEEAMQQFDQLLKDIDAKFCPWCGTPLVIHEDPPPTEQLPTDEIRVGDEAEERRESIATPLRGIVEERRGEQIRFRDSNIWRHDSFFRKVQPQPERPYDEICEPVPESKECDHPCHNLTYVGWNFCCHCGRPLVRKEE